MNILVTGGCGFIGSNFIRQRLTEDASPLRKLVNLDLLTYAGNPANLADLASDSRYVFQKGDIGDEELVARLLAEHDIDAIVNFAAESHVDRSIDSPEPFIQTNVTGTLRLLNAARRHWSNLPDGRREKFRFLHVSTDEVFGSLGETGFFSETTAYDPRSPYSASKAASDHLVSAWGHTFGLPVLISNCSNNYGPYQFPEKLIPVIILKALAGEPLPVYGDGANIRDWLYVGDHASALERIITHGRIGETYAVGGRSERRNIEVVSAILDLVDELAPDRGTPRSEIRFVTDRPGHDRRYAIDSTRIETELGWRRTETFETGLRRTVQWYIDRRDWWGPLQEKQGLGARLGLRGSP